VEHTEIMNKNFTRSHNYYFAPILILVFSLCVLFGNTAAQDFKQTHPGVEYALVEHKIGEDPVKINLLRLDLSKVRLDVHKGFDRSIGLETTSSIAKRKGAVAAINAGFFRLDRSDFAGDAAGVLMIDGSLLSESVGGRSAVIISNEKRYTSVFFSRIDAETSLQLGPRERLSSFPISGIDRESKDNEIVLYTPRLGRPVPNGDGSTLVVLRRCKAGKRLGSFRNIACRETELASGGFDQIVPPSGYILAIGRNVEGEKEIVRQRIIELVRTKKAKTNIQIRHTIMVNNGQYTTDKKVDITNGVARLIKEGKIDINWEQEKAGKAFVFNRHPRTAVAKMKDGKFLMITVDGRQPGVSVGMTLPELAEYLHSLGAIDAMNLDGGGSTTMVLGGKVVNTPSDPTGERKVGDAILFTPRSGAR
jgi:exopolysaccharide biosynthesis protein